MNDYQIKYVALILKSKVIKEEILSRELRLEEIQKEARELCDFLTGNELNECSRYLDDLAK